MITPETYHALGLSDEEYQKIIDVLKREPTPTELAMFSVEWSEHCGYLCSKKLLRTLPQTGKCQTLIGEDSGGIIIDDWAIVFKMESHNHPSQVEPMQGAATGVGGIIRDIFTAGARPIASLNSLRFGNLSIPYNKYLLREVVHGIGFYGNCVGIPTVGGEIYFDDSYNGNCLVNAMNIGIAKKEDLARAQAFGIGNPIMYVGSSTGRDGIGGCSVLASNEFDEGEEKRPTVQIGDPFTEKCLIEATLEALATGYILGIKDMGAAGLTCSISEMAAAGDSGIEADLGFVPRREEGMEAWEIMMSESQERMLVCIEKGKEDEIKKIFEKWELNAAVIGYVIEDKIVKIVDRGEIVADIPTAALTDPILYDLPFEEPDYIKECRSFDFKTLSETEDFSDNLLRLLSSPSIASKKWIYEQYDHMVQTNTVTLPGAADAAVIRIKNSNQAIAATTDCNSRYCFLNPYIGAQIAVAEAARNLVCSGAEPLAVTDCLNFGNPKKKDRFWQFKNCIEGIVEACKFFDTPVISGNVSFYNESPDGAINPTPSIGMIGHIKNIQQATTQNFKEANQSIILLGKCKQEFGGSEYLKVIHGLVKGDAPSLDLELEKSVQQTAFKAISEGLVVSAHDCAEGGLAVALAECCISNIEKPIGALVTNLSFNISKNALLFGETQSRIILSCRNEAVAKIEKIAEENNTPFAVIGKTGGDDLVIEVAGDILIAASLIDLKQAWENAIGNELEQK